MGILASTKKAVRNWLIYRNTVRELSSLDSRTLTDLGITREDIRDIARDHRSSL